MTRLLIALIAAAAAAAAQTARPNPPHASAPARSGAAHTRKGGAAPKLSDAELEKTIQAKFAKSKISVNHFQVNVQGGTATIEGRTNVVQHKATATRLARLAGATAVNNKVQVSEEARQKAADKLASGRRRAQVKRSEAVRR